MADPTWWKRPLNLPERYRNLSFEMLEGPEEATAMLAERAALEAGPVSVLEEVGRLRAPTPEHVLLNVTAGPSGELIALWCDAADEHVIVKTADSERHVGPGSRAPHPVAMTITVDTADALRAAQVRVPEVRLTYPVVDAALDGTFSIVSGVCELRTDGPDLNGIVVDAQGDVLRHITLGDGVLSTQATAGGKTWVGYSDTGILGNNGWNTAGHDDATARSRTPVGAFGLVRFDDEYSVEWEFGRAWYESGRRDREIIDHVYALNVVDETAWVYYHSAYSIARVLNDDIRVWNTDVELAHGLLVDGARQALVGGYGPQYDRIVIGHLDDNDFVRDSTGRIVLPDGSDLPLTTRRTSRGSTHHVIAGDRWYRLVL